ncbi:MAG TPA: tRNA lysidine(34) synthetase TilS [Actinomycetota bacterium]
MAARRPPAVARVLERITMTARTHGMFTPGDLVLLWVSGGPDSVCLLESLVRLRRLFRIRLAVFHMDHRLREGSAMDAAYVRRLAERHGLAFHLAVAVHRPGRSDSIEMWARFERAREAARVAREIGATRMADGHTLDDQAETILMGLVLGWGLEGMGGIAPVNGALVRPMLDVTREDVAALCRALHLRPRHDPTNADTTLLRNALRLDAIPAIERSTGREVKRTFARTADHLRRDATTLFAQADQHAKTLIEVHDRGFAIRARPLLDLPPALSSRVARRGFQRADLGWDHEAIDAVLDLAAGSPGRKRDLLLGIRARRTRTHVEVEG